MVDDLLDCGFLEHTYFNDNGEEKFLRKRLEGEQILADLISFFGEIIDEAIYPLHTLYFLIEASEDMDTIRYFFIENRAGGVTVAYEEISEDLLAEFLEEIYGAQF